MPDWHHHDYEDPNLQYNIKVVVYDGVSLDEVFADDLVVGAGRESGQYDTRNDTQHDFLLVDEKNRTDRSDPTDRSDGIEPERLRQA